jgi:hypothetical protein
MTEQIPPDKDVRPSSDVGPVADSDIATIRTDPWGLDPRTGMPPELPPGIVAREDNVNSSDDW